MHTSIACSRRRYSKGIASIFALLFVAPIGTFAQTKTENLYLLGETTSGNPRWSGSGLSLYTLDSSHNLKLVREIVPVPDPTRPGDFGNSLYAVRDDMGDKIYVMYPDTVPSILSVIHKAKPAMKDEVDFNPHHFTVLPPDLGIAAGVGRQSYLLCTFLRPIPNYKGPYPGGINSSLVSVAGDAPAEGPRVRGADWTVFKEFRYEGGPRGPQSDVLGYIKDNQVRIQAEPGAGPFTLPADLDLVPPFPLETAPGNVIVIVAANSRYFAFVPLVRLWKEDPSLYTGAPYACVHDRERNTWKRLTSASTEATRRIFGSWLATIVEVSHPGEFVENPGAKPGEGQISFPGTLVLDNLDDGRKIVLNTGQADSEILAVREDGLVLYRVNDAIFAAQIELENLSEPTLVVKDEAVPGVHWIFWSLSQASSSKSR